DQRARGYASRGPKHCYAAGLQHETKRSDLRHHEIGQPDHPGERDETCPSPCKMAGGELLAGTVLSESLGHPVCSRLYPSVPDVLHQSLRTDLGAVDVARGV